MRQTNLLNCQRDLTQVIIKLMNYCQPQIWLQQHLKKLSLILRSNWIQMMHAKLELTSILKALWNCKWILIFLMPQNIHQLWLRRQSISAGAHSKEMQTIFSLDPNLLRMRSMQLYQIFCALIQIKISLSLAMASHLYNNSYQYEYRDVKVMVVKVNRRLINSSRRTACSLLYLIKWVTMLTVMMIRLSDDI